MTIEGLNKLKEKIETAKQKRSKAEGSLERLKEQLQADFGCASLKEAESKILELEETCKKDNERLEELLQEIEEVADWGNI